MSVYDSVYDKELVINGKAVRSPEQQVWKNMKDIKALQLKIKEAYKCVGELNTESISVARSLTNVPSNVEEGWLLDTAGNLFNITGGDENSLLLEFYCNIKGPQGETGPSGAELEIDDTGTSASKVWSSQKVAQELASAGKQYYQHNITGIFTNIRLLITIVSDSDESMTASDIIQWLKNKNYRNDNAQNKYYNLATYFLNGNLYSHEISYLNDTSISCILLSGTTTSLTLGDLSIKDHVEPL